MGALAVRAIACTHIQLNRQFSYNSYSLTVAASMSVLQLSV